MFEKYLNFVVRLNEIYSLESKDLALRKIALVLTSFIPLLLLFSRVAADAALTITGVLFVIHCIRAKDYSYLKQPIVITLILLWIWFMVSSCSALANNIHSFLSSFVYIRFILFFASCIYWLFTDIKALQFAGKIILMTIMIAASDALFQFISGFSISGKPHLGGRLTSFLRRPDIGIYLAKLIFPIIALQIWSVSNSADKRTVSLNCFLLFFVIAVIFLTGERTATALSLCGLTIALLITAINSSHFRMYTITAIGSIIGAFILIVYKVPFIYQRTIEFVRDVSHFPNSLYGQLFKASILSWYNYGIFTGVGIHQFRNSCPAFKEEGLVTYCDIHSHNLYLEILSESGIIGLCLFIIFVFLCLRQVALSAISERKNLGRFVSSILALAGLFTILFPISVTMSFITNWSATLNWTGISLCMSVLMLNSRK